MAKKMVMPANYAMLDADEMVYTEGGALNEGIFAMGTLGGVAIGFLMLIPAVKYRDRMLAITKTMEDEIYGQTILYLKDHPDANQTLAEYEGRTMYLASDRYKELMAEYNACNSKNMAWGLGAVGVMVVGTFGGLAVGASVR